MPYWDCATVLFLSGVVFARPRPRCGTRDLCGSGRTVLRCLASQLAHPQTGGSSRQAQERGLWARARFLRRAASGIPQDGLRSVTVCWFCGDRVSGLCRRSWRGDTTSLLQVVTRMATAVVTETRLSPSPACGSSPNLDSTHKLSPWGQAMSPQVVPLRRTRRASGEWSRRFVLSPPR